MFSLTEKRHIAEKLEQIILELKHPEMPTERAQFKLRIEGKEPWSWAEVQPNWAFEDVPPTINPWNEAAREIL